jgi:hypothetical protein
MAKVRRRRLYPFMEPMRSDVNTSSNTAGTIVNWKQTTYKPNPFHGIDRWLFALDEWGHRNIDRWWHRPPFAWYCRWWDRRLFGKDA